MASGNSLRSRRSGRIIPFVGFVILLTLISPGVSGYWPSRLPRPGGESPAPDDLIPPDPVSSDPARPGSAHQPQILAAKIETDQTIHWAFYYSDGKYPAGDSNENGKALGGFRLLCPVNNPHVTSGYAPRRYHPILKYYRPHLAVDYAAPAGTPIRAPAGGIIEYAGWKNGWGRYLSLRHNSTYTTTYGHLSRYAPGIKKGVWVRQGQIIGYVGSSGLATRPHLCYRLLQHGKSIDPLTFHVSVGPPISNPEDFQAVKGELIVKLEGLPRAAVSAPLSTAQAGH